MLVDSNGYGGDLVPHVPESLSADPHEVAPEASKGRTLPDPDPDVYDLLAEPEPEHDWVVPDLLERADRVVVTGAEGQGKSTLLRQIGVRLAAGLHPFKEQAISPARVLYVDLENGRRLVRSKLRGLVGLTDGCLPPGMFVPIIKPEGLDLRRAQDHAWLHGRMLANRPDVLIIGPLYKMADGDPTQEETAKAVSVSIDHLRVEHRCAVMIEAHPPHASNGGRRPLRPYGASLWLRWPEFGLGLNEAGQLIHWRGQRDERAWPSLLQRGGTWPWTVAHDPKAHTFAALLDAVMTAGHVMSVRELELATGIPKSTVDRAIKANQRHWDRVIADLVDPVAEVF